MLPVRYETDPISGRPLRPTLWGSTVFMIWGLRALALIGAAMGMGWLYPWEPNLSSFVSTLIAVAVAQALAALLGRRKRQLAAAVLAYEQRMLAVFD